VHTLVDTVEHFPCKLGVNNTL